ncbi:MAG: NADH:flavin oxidoreductase, partial [Oscillospiraceae bacterium]|nr:NADH:flavin oxidoreductase [Oscillospiraceae bacterium]
EGVVCESGTGEKLLIEADTVLCAAGLRPRSEIADALRGTAPIVELIGDCVKPDIIRGATWRAYHAALDL